jgi:streptogramin lyase
MAFDHSGNLWIANSGSGGGISEFNGAGTALTSSLITAGGVSNPLALAVDGVGQIWIANGNGSVSVLNNSGSAVTPSTGYTGSGLATPGGIAIDGSGNVWVTNASNNSVTEIVGGAAPVAPLATSLTNATTGARP